MQYCKHLPNFILSLGIACFSITTAWTLAQPEIQAGGRQQKTRTVSELPKIISKVKDVEVVDAVIIGQDEGHAVIVIEVRNNSDKPIIALAVESGDEKDSSGVSLNGFRNDDEPPAVILRPYDTLKVRMPLSYVWPGTPVRVGGVMYLDGTEEGEEITLGTLRRQKEHKKESKKGDTSPQ